MNDILDYIATPEGWMTRAFCVAWVLTVGAEVWILWKLLT